MPFVKTFGAIKEFARNAVDKVKHGFRNYAPKILDISQKGLGILGTVPGHMGAIARTAQVGADFLKKIVGEIPNEAAKTKLTGIIDKGSKVIDNSAVASTHFANQAINRAKPWIDAADRIVKHGNSSNS